MQSQSRTQTPCPLDAALYETLDLLAMVVASIRDRITVQADLQ